MSRAGMPHLLGPLDLVPDGEGRVFQIDGRDVAVFRCRSGRVFATDAACPHRGGPLADGLVGPDSVVCPLHGQVFDLTTGEARGGGCERLATYRVAVTADRELALELP